MHFQSLEKNVMDDWMFSNLLSSMCVFYSLLSSSGHPLVRGHSGLKSSKNVSFSNFNGNASEASYISNLKNRLCWLKNNGKWDFFLLFKTMWKLPKYSGVTHENAEKQSRTVLGDPFSLSLLVFQVALKFLAFLWWSTLVGKFICISSKLNLDTFPFKFIEWSSLLGWS